MREKHNEFLLSLKNSRKNDVFRLFFKKEDSPDLCRISMLVVFPRIMNVTSPEGREKRCMTSSRKISSLL